jgi:hypothetical protein
MTFKHVLVPVWIGTYHYQGKEYHLLVNGQTGKVGGYKPRDTTKVAMSVLISLAVIGLIIVLYWLWSLSGGAP